MKKTNLTRRHLLSGLGAGAVLPLLPARALAAFVAADAVQAKVLVYSRGDASTRLLERIAGSTRKEPDERGGRFSTATVRRAEPLDGRELRLSFHAVNGAGSKWLQTAVVATDAVVIAFDAGGQGRAETMKDVKKALASAGIGWGTRPTFFAVETSADPAKARDVEWDVPSKNIPVEPVRLSDGAGVSTLVDRLDEAIRRGLAEGVVPRLGAGGAGAGSGSGS